MNMRYIVICTYKILSENNLVDELNCIIFPNFCNTNLGWNLIKFGCNISLTEDKKKVAVTSEVVGAEVRLILPN